jgi:hypothetical protein
MSAAFMNEARQLAAQCWCDKETENIEMDVRLAEAMARRLAAWMEDAARFSLNEQYYRGLVVRCGKALGIEARTSDDGGVHDTVLCAKVPELVERLVAEVGQPIAEPTLK